MSKDNNHLAAIKVIKKKLLGKKLTYQEIYTLMDEIAHQHLSDVLTTYFVAASFKEEVIFIVSGHVYPKSFGCCLFSFKNFTRSSSIDQRVIS